jgi:hypothetical protein
MNYRLLIFFFILIATSWACPYCAGQSGENYVQQVILPIGALLVSPFVIMGSISLIIYLNREK